jgi:hypothetical protein
MGRDALLKGYLACFYGTRTAHEIRSSLGHFSPSVHQDMPATCCGARKLQRSWHPPDLFHRSVVWSVTATVFSQLSTDRLSATLRGESRR